MAALGRISGPLLKANLERLGVNLAFETDLLYLDVVNSRIGVRTSSPQYELDVNGTTRSTNLEVTSLANIADITISGNTIETSSATLNLATADTVVYQNKLRVDSIDIENNFISTNTSNADLILTANGTGIISIPNNNVTISQDLTVTGATTLTDVTSSGNISVTGNVTVGQDLTINQAAQFENIRIDQNVISTTDSNSNLELSPNGSGTVEIFANTNVYGNIFATGNVTAEGDIIIGDADTDSITFNAEVASNIIPDADDTYTLGSDSKRWANIWVNNFIAGNINTEDLEVDGVNLGLRQGNIIYVAENGNDLNTGTHQNDPKASIAAALSLATDGDTVYVYPGVYQEVFPLTVKKGVTLRGFGIRSVKITPTPTTRYNDAFLLNGETTVEDITVADFNSGGNFFAVTEIVNTLNFKVNVGTAPFAHTYVSGGIIISDDSTIANVSNAVYNHTTGELTITTDVPHDTYLGANLFLKDLTFSCNGGTRVFPDNGYAFRFATNFEVTSRSPYIRNITVITQGSVTSPSDPRGFDSGDAGKGVYIDGAYATANSREASMLFHSVTFITPGVDALTATNGARIEWLNSFTYFANRSMYAYDSNDGLRGNGRTSVRVSDVTGVYTIGETLQYISDDGSTVLASGVIDEVDPDGKLYLTGKVIGLETAKERAGKIVVANVNAQLDTAEKKFGTASLLLDGIGDYVSVAAQNDFGFGTGDFAVECFVYANDLTGSKTVFDFRAGAATNNAVQLYIDSGTPKVYINGSDVLISGSTISTASWIHLALTRNSGTMSLYVNGTRVASATVSTDLGTTKPLVIGSIYSGGPENWDGWIDEVRISKGVARYTGTTLVVPISEFTSDTNTVLLLHFNGTDASTDIDDDSLQAQTITFSGGASANYIDFVDYTDFGAEVRSIASASVYGNFGIEGDGPGVIMYLISHNLAYIGLGKSVDNDPTNVIQANEVIELNNAKIRYSSVDHNGDFRVGDLFYVNQSTGTVTFTTANFNIDSTTGLTFTSGPNVTFIDGTTVDTGNISIHDNTVETTVGDLNLAAASGNINFQNNVNVTGNIDVSGNVTIGGNITIGDADTDSINIIAEVVSDIVPDQTSTYNLGSPVKTWNTVFAGKLNIDDVEINNNYITTTASNADLELRANGTGRVYIPDNDVLANQSFTVNGTTTLSNAVINGSVTVTGPITQTGDINLTGNMTISGIVDVAGEAQFENININDNYITTTQSNSDLELRANGTGKILIPDNNIEIDNDLIVNGLATFSDINSNGTITANSFSTGDILIDDNFITTTIGNNNLELRANGTGLVYIPSNDLELDQNLIVNGTTTLGDTNITGTVVHVGNTTQTGNFNLTGNMTISQTITVAGEAQFENININDNYITTTQINSDLELGANGTGEVVVPSNDVVFNQNITVNGTATIADINSSGTITANSFSTGDILIDDNFITTTQSNSDLELRANGTGSIVIDNLNFNTNIISTDTTDLVLQPSTGVVNINSTASLRVPRGTVLQRPAVPQVGMLRYNTDGNYFEGWTGAFWIRMSQGVIDVDGDTRITAELTPGSNDNTIRFYTNGNLVADLTASRFRSDKLVVDDLQIDGNVISSITANTNIVLSPNGIGSVVFENFSINNSTITNTVSNAATLFATTANGYVKIDTTNGFVLPVGDSTNRPPLIYTETGMLRFNTQDSRVEVYDGTNWTSVAGTSSGISISDAENIAIERILMLG